MSGLDAVLHMSRLILTGSTFMLFTCNIHEAAKIGMDHARKLKRSKRINVLRLYKQLCLYIVKNKSHLHVPRQKPHLSNI